MVDATSDLDEDVGLDTEDRKHIHSNRQEWFKGEKGVTYRASLCYFNTLHDSVATSLRKKAKVKEETPPTEEAIQEILGKLLAKRAETLSKSVDQLQPHDKLDLNNARFKKMIAHYNNDRKEVGYVVSRLGKDGAEADAIWKLMGEPKTYFSTLLLFYPTNRQGEPVRDQIASGWSLKPWRFASKTYERFHVISESLKSNDLIIVGQDLTLKCTNTDFQNFDVDAAGKAIWRQDARFQAKVLEQAVALYPKMNPFRELSTAELRIKLGLSSGTATGGGEDVGTDEFSGILSEV